jgi:hypothetical protein
MRGLPNLPTNIVLLAHTSFFADVSSEMLYPSHEPPRPMPRPHSQPLPVVAV